MPPKLNSTDPKKPKGRTSAYALFVQDKRRQFKEAGKEVGFKEFSQLCAEEWKVLDKTSAGKTKKEHFMELAEKDKQRYDKEMKHYEPSPGYNYKGKLEGGKKKKKKKDKDPNMPKRAMSAFMFFCQDKRPRLKEQNPSATVGELAKQLGAAWGSVSDDDKTFYQAKADKDRERYAKEKEDYFSRKSSEVLDDEDEDEDDVGSEDED